MRASHLATLTLTLVGLAAAARAQERAPDPPVPGDGVLTMALVGDAIITRALSPHTEPAFVEMIERIRGADLAFANLEMLFHDYEPAPMYQSGGTYMRADPAMAQELTWAGFDMVSMANNHTGDYGPLGGRLTRKYVRAAGLVGAGSGEDLFEAREAKFRETADGRVALIALAATFPEHSMASEPGAATRGRPGLSFLRHDRWQELAPEPFETLREALRGAGVRVAGTEESFFALGTRFRVGDEPGSHTAANAEDLAAVTAVVRDASELADYVIVSIHAHESFGRRTVPAEFVVEFAHAVIDAGADVVVGHGPHVLRGVEVYGGKPILYSLGDFVFENETLLRLPSENYAPYGLDPDAGVSAFNRERYRGDTRGFPADREIWEGALAMPSFRGGELMELRLLPLTLGFGKPRTERGRPLLAEGDLAREILDNLVERSAAFGTTIEQHDGIGVLRLQGG